MSILTRAYPNGANCSQMHIYMCVLDCNTLSWVRVALADRRPGESAWQPKVAPPGSICYGGVGGGTRMQQCEASW